ncbi:hypothetical protein HOLleu_17036 [Holothuria leucospilota]|uniref:Uncharacterized protein n=1 Tax=Holothuria leucospilota TaxID=206669 RepID=A0A9Q1C6N6_HOLLE|nr:hypothetical protein HOLleu_17036 [Holothuria leucospilota]
MAHGRWNVLVLVFVYIILLPSLKAQVLCPAAVNVFERVNNVTCSVDPNNVLCLVCPILKSANEPEWYRGHKTIYRRGHKTGEEIYLINECHSTLNSLKLTEIEIDQHRKVFSCIPGEPANATYSFTVELKGT